LDEGYSRFLTSRLGGMVFRMLSGLVNDGYARCGPAFIKQSVLKCGSPPVTGQRWTNVAAYEGIHLLRRQLPSLFNLIGRHKPSDLVSVRSRF